MPFLQPASSTIKQYHFRGKTYAFPVESVMASASGGGQLSLTVSEGYALKISPTESPQNQHTIDYTEQPDGSWLVRNTVTLVATASSLLSGTVTLRDPMGVTLRMAINIEPALFIDDAPIIFDETKPGKSTAALLTIRQHGATTPVSLRIDPINAFTIADAKMAFITTSGLSLTPSFEGANVILSYTPKKRGNYVARLLVVTPYDTKTIPLVGQTGGLLSWLPKLSVPASLTSASLTRMRPSFTRPALRWEHLAGALAFTVVMGLIWGSYTLLSRSKNTIDLAVLDRRSTKPIGQFALSTSHNSEPASQPFQPELPSSDSDAYAEEAEPTQQSQTFYLPTANVRVTTRPEEKDQPNERAIVRATSSQPEPQQQTASPKPAFNSLTDSRLTVQSKPSQIAHTKNKQITQAASSIGPVEKVSDLEKELNTPIYHKDKP